MPNSRKGSCRRVKIRGHSFQEAPRTSGNVSRSERSKKRWPEDEGAPEAVSLGRRNPLSARSAGGEGGSCPSHAPSQLEPLGTWAPGCPWSRGKTTLPTDLLEETGTRAWQAQACC